jgi:hypothetical protein
MPIYVVNFGTSYQVEAADAEAAADAAYDLCRYNWGKEFAQDAWMTDPEEIY